LKTLGLFILMHQFGMEIPASHGSSLPLVSGVYADVGDEQSIEESLSTFSGHMRRLSYIMSKADENSLVLLDELGGGTDPHEGAALAMAILDWFASKASMLVITTHLGVMKNYGYTRPGSLNASVTFDDETLRPTYHILQGIPGESHALEIASANGMSADLIETARTYLEGEESDVAAMIRELQETQNRLRDQENELKRMRTALEEERRQVDLKALRLRQKEIEIRENQFGDLRGYVRESRKFLENLVAELKSGPVNREQTRRVKSFIAELTEKEEEVSRKLDRDQESLEAQLESEAPAEADTSEDRELNEGQEVLVGPHKKTGILVRKDKKGRWLVAVGTLKMTLSEKELTPVKPRTQKVSVTSSSSGKYAVMELDLRGYRMEEALRLLEKQVDDALMAGLDQFSVIHGLGEGVLQKGVHDYLRHCPAVQKFQFAHPDQGGYGKTEVTLA
jgi:DNA mismatch repair protein MutS2